MDNLETDLILRGKKVSRTNQLFVSFAATLGTMAANTVVGYTSPAVPLLTHPVSPADGSLRLTQAQASLFSSSINLSAAVGCLVGGYAINKLGRKLAILLLCVVYVIGWIITGTAPNFGMLMFGRIVSGLCLGATCVMIPTFIGEIASPDIRGALMSTFQVMGSVGNIWAYSLGSVISSWRWLTSAMVIPPVLCFILMLFAKESPLFLLMKGKDQMANDALQFYRGKHNDCASEMDSLRRFLEDSKRNKASVKDLLKPYNLKPFLICITILFFTQCSGITPVIYNLSTIFQDAGTNLSGSTSSIIIGVVQMLACIVSAVLMDRAGRKMLLIISSAVMTLSLYALGYYFYAKAQDADWAREHLGWLPLTSLIIYIAFTSIGFLTVQWVMLGELFSPEVREVAGSIAILPAWLLGFTFAIAFVPMQNAIGAFGVYWAFGGMCVLALIFSVIVVPETKGKAMQEISEFFGGPTAEDSLNQFFESSNYSQI